MNQTRSKKPLVVAIHGFLGLPQDWDFLKNEERYHLWALYLWKDYSSLSVDDFVHQFCFDLMAKMKSLDVDKIYLVGYSLGGRLALEILNSKKVEIGGALLISVHPGLAESSDREKRILSDQMWSHEFLSSPWEDVLNKWNSQDVFGTSDSCDPDRRGLEIYREALSRAILSWSLAHQNNARSYLAHTSVPVIWMVGRKDLKFWSIAQGLRRSHSLRVVVAESGHRVIFKNPETVQAALEDLFLPDVQKN